MTTKELARKAGQTKTPAKAAAARVNGRAGRQSRHPAVVAAREWWRNIAPRNMSETYRDGYVSVVRGSSTGWRRDLPNDFCLSPNGTVAVPVAGGAVMRYNGSRWVSARVQCGPLAPTPEPAGYICAPYLRDLARQIHELRDAWQIAEVQRALNSAAELIERLQSKTK